MAYQDLPTPTTRPDGKIEFNIGNVAGVVTVRRKASGNNPPGIPLTIGTFTQTPGGGYTPPEEGSTVTEIAENYHTLTARPAPQLTPLQTFYDALETAGVWDKFVFANLLRGTSEGMVKINLFDPATTPDALNAIFSGTVTPSETGTIFAAASGKLDTGIHPDSIDGYPNVGVTVYEDTLLAGCTVWASDAFNIWMPDTDGRFYCYSGVQGGVSTPLIPGGNQAGLKTAQRVGMATQLFFGNALKVSGVITEGTEEKTHTEDKTIKFHTKFGGGATDAEGKYSFISVHQPFTEAEQTAVANAITTLLTNLTF